MSEQNKTVNKHNTLEEIGPVEVGNINKINYINKNNNNNKIVNYHFSSEKETSSQSSTTSFENTSLPSNDFVLGQESLDSKEKRSVVGEDDKPEKRDYDADVANMKFERDMDVSYAKLSVWRKPKEILIAIAYRNAELYGNKLQYVQYSLTPSVNNFLHNLNNIWGPGTRKRELYHTIATGMKAGYIEQAGKGRPKVVGSTGSSRRAPLYANSVCMMYPAKDKLQQINIWHNGVKLKFVLDQHDFLDAPKPGKPIATKEYRRSETYGF